jgi:hypothetical protein
VNVEVPLLIGRRFVVGRRHSSDNSMMKMVEDQGRWCVFAKQGDDDEAEALSLINMTMQK